MQFLEPVKELSSICKKKGIIIIYDAAHVLGLIAGKQFQSPLNEGALLITGSTHKTFFGSQRGIVISNTGEKDWREIDKGAFPGSSSNHHLDTLAALSMATYEMMEFGEEYSKQIISNSKALGEKMYDCGFKVEAAEFGFTESHQLAINVSEFGGGDYIGRHLTDNNIILNMNLLPFEPLANVKNPAGVRIGVQEMTRFGMKEDEMGIIAELLKKCIIDGKYVGDDAIEFRRQYQKVNYTFDEMEISLEKEVMMK